MEYPESVIRVYEEYILALPKDREAAISKLVKGSMHYKILKCFDVLNSTSQPQEDKEFLDEVLNEFTNQKYLNVKTGKNELLAIWIRTQLAKYQDSTSNEEKLAIMKSVLKRACSIDLDKLKKPIQMEINQEGTSSKILGSLDDNDYNEEAFKRKMDDFKEFKESLTAIARIKFIDYDDIFERGECEVFAYFENNQTFLKKFVSYHTNFTKQGHIYSNFHKFTLLQLESLCALSPAIKKLETVNSHIFNKRFDREIHTTYSNPNTKRAALIKMYTFLKNANHVKDVKRLILLEILVNGLECNIKEESFFCDYFILPITNHKLFLRYEKLINQYSSYNSYKSILSPDLASVTPKFEASIAKKYLSSFFRGQFTIEIASQYFKEAELHAWHNHYLLKRGDKVSLTSTEIEKISSKVILEFLESNRLSFTNEESVKMWIRVKAIPSLYIKLFSINAKNYYLLTNKAFDVNTNIDGLIPAHELVYNYKEPPQVEHIEEFEFPMLLNKKGICLIEFIGNGKTARAIVKKGSLSVITTYQPTTQTFQIIDSETLTPCQGEDTGLYYQKKFYKADNAGQVTIDYDDDSNQETNIIACSNSIAELIPVSILSHQEIMLNCSFYMVPESAILGNASTILIRPQLHIQQHALPLSCIKNAKCQIYSKEYINNSSSIKSIDELTSINGIEYAITFQTPPNVYQLEFTFIAEVASKEGVKTLSSKFNTTINCFISSAVISYSYLRKQKDSYYLEFRGKGGEGIPNLLTSVYLTSIYSSAQFEFNCITDKMGRIPLGKLTGIVSVKANANNSETVMTPTYLIDEMKSIYYQKEYCIATNETLEIPVYEPFSPNYLRLYSYNSLSEHVIRTVNEGFKIIQPNKSIPLYIISITGLAPGNYKLFSNNFNTSIQINVKEGIAWKGSYVRTNNEIIKKVELSMPLGVYECTEKDGNLNVSIVNSTTSTVLNAFCFHYLPTSLEISTYFRNFDYSPYYESDAINQNTSIYASNNNLPYELHYVMMHRAAKNSISNTVERPRLLIKRQEFGVSETDAEPVGRNAVRENYRNIKKQGKEKNQKSTSFGIYGSEYFPVINSYDNFIQNAPYCTLNIKPNENGKFIVALPKEEYSFMLLIAEDYHRACSYVHSLSSAAYPNVRNLCVTKSLDISKNLREVEDVILLSKHEQMIIEDISNFKMQIVDSLNKLYLISGILIKECDKEKWRDFSFLMKWNSMRKDQKNTTYWTYMSHELNLYIYFKDPTYFEEIVKSSIQYKAEKTFIDYWLLKDSRKLKEYYENITSTIAQQNSTK